MIDNEDIKTDNTEEIEKIESEKKEESTTDKKSKITLSNAINKAFLNNNI